MGSRFTDKAERALNAAVRTAERLGHTYVGTEHVLLSVASEELSCASVLLNKNGASAVAIEQVIRRFRGSEAPTVLTSKHMTPRCRRVVESSYQNARKYASEKIGTEHILLSILDERECVATKLLACIDGCDVATLKDEVVTFLRSDAVCHTAARPSPTTGLLKYGRDLTALAREGGLDAVVGREAETERLIRVLCRRTKNNPCLIGEAGVGKTAIVEGLALRIASGDVPPLLRSARIVSIDMSALVAGTKYRGDFEERVRGVVDEATKQQNLLLFIDEIHTIVGAGAAEGTVDAANILKPELARGTLHLIGATTVKEYRTTIERDAALERRFQSIRVEEPDADACLTMLEGVRAAYERHHGLRISEDALEACVRLSARYITDRCMPDKALDLLDETCADVHMKTGEHDAESQNLEEKIRQTKIKEERYVLQRDFRTAFQLRDLITLYERQLAERLPKQTAPVTVTGEDVCRVVSAISGVRMPSLSDGETYIQGLRERLRARIIGQDAAVDAVTNALICSRAGLGDPGRPTGVFLFVGESGVGKTELAKALAAEVVGNEQSLLRFDMSEFSEAHTVSKLIGSPPGYVGYGEGGALTERIRRSPYTVVLFDEIEKAHPDVLHLLLQVNDEGVLTDACGQRVSFRHACIVYTSNALSDAHRRLSHIGFTDAAQQGKPTREELCERLRTRFSSEWLGRMDEIVLFSPLGEGELRRIGERLVLSVCERLSDRGITLTVREEVLSHLAAACRPSPLGARPLMHRVREQIEEPLACLLLAGAIGEGDHLSLSEDGGQLVVLKEQTDGSSLPVPCIMHA